MIEIKKRYDLRFAIGTPDGPRSNLWAVFSRNNQVYASSASGGGVSKLSFHTPLLCRNAFTKERAKEVGMETRSPHEWQRPATPPPGSGHASCVATIGFPTDVLSTALEKAKEPEVWINAAPPGMIVVIEMMFTLDPQNTIEAELEGGQRTLVAYWPLKNGETFVVASRTGTWEGEDFRMPGSHHEKRDLVISQLDPNATGRPIRLTMFTQPKDGDALVGWEHGGYWAESTASAGPTFTRNVVLDRSSKGPP